MPRAWYQHIVDSQKFIGKYTLWYSQFPALLLVRTNNHHDCYGCLCSHAELRIQTGGAPPHNMTDIVAMIQ